MTHSTSDAPTATTDGTDSTRGWHHPITWLELIVANLRRLLVFLAGVTLLGAGLAMLVLPGPGLLVSIVGLAVLATEFAWAERTLDQAKDRTRALTDQLDDSRVARGAMALSALSLIVGGAAVGVVVGSNPTLGLSLAVGGTCALAVLVPAVRRWVLR